MPEIRTPRLRLVRASAEMLRADLESARALSEAIGVEVAAEWPPELYDADAIQWTLQWMEANPDDLRWGFYYLVERDAESGERVIGASGYKGAPDDGGAVELGYSVVPERRRRGFAREAVDGLLAYAFAEPAVSRVLAHTLADLLPSIAVLHSAGFRFVGAGADPTEAEAVQYEITRDAYRRTLDTRHPADLTRADSPQASPTPSSR